MNFVKQHDVVDLVNKKSAKDPDSGSVLSSDTNLKSRNRSSSRRRVENKRHQVGQPPKPPAPNLSIVQTSLSGPPPPPAPPGPPPPPPMPLNLPPTIPMQIERPKTSGRCHHPFTDIMFECIYILKLSLPMEVLWRKSGTKEELQELD